MSLAAVNITHRLGPRFRIVDLSLDVEAGAMTALLGPNGSGKTTLIRLLAGLLRPDNGRIELDGRDLATIEPIDRARRIAYVSQSWRPAFSFTVEQTVLLGRAPHRRRAGGLEGPDDLASAEHAMRRIGLLDLRSVPVTELSGGERRRVMIASALAQEASILLLDEPTTHLDVAYQQEIMRLMHELVAEEGITILASLHDLNLASIYADRVVVMRDGAIIGEGSPSETLTPDRLRDGFSIDLDVEPAFYGTRPIVRFRGGES